MSVNPGVGGQSFLTSQLAKIAHLRRMIDARMKGGADHPITLAVDGGITAATAPAAIAAGADTLIAGTSVFRAPDYASAIKTLRGRA
jgi:ribulose-phosphate 3-epimerase